MFAKEVVCVVGENASQLEIESAEATAANSENLTGNKLEISNTSFLFLVFHSTKII
ncbi:MAG: hypothetical protein C5S38_08520 [Candidatus Methanophagaceae archaeon]|nr:MAG: hypothetical protein C5S38_08520 [Methanophagales archaeon]